MQGIILTQEMIALIPEWGGNAVLVALCLVYYGDGETSAPDYNDIEKFTGLNRHAIKPALETLKARGVIQITRRFSQSSIYSISALVALLHTNNILNNNISNNNTNTLLQCISEENALMDERTDEPGPLAKLTDAFTEITQIPCFGISPKDVEAGNRMIKAGITPDDVKAACKKLLAPGNDYTLTGLKSIEKTAYSERAKRNGNNHQQDSVIQRELKRLEESGDGNTGTDYSYLWKT